MRCGRCAFVFDARTHFVAEPAPAPRPAPAPSLPPPAVIPPPPPAVVPRQVEPSPKLVAHVAAANESDDDGYGAQSVSAQLSAAASVEPESAQSLTQQSLQQLAAALAASAPEPTPKPASTMMELNLDLDDVPPLPLAPPVASPLKVAVPSSEPKPSAPPTRDAAETTEHNAEEALALALSRLRQTSQRADESEASGHSADDAEQDNEPEREASSYHPIFTAEDEALLRVPKAPSPWRWLWSVPLFLAVLVLIGQLSYFYRTELSVQLPGIKPYLVRFCAQLRCKVELPARAELLRTEWSELNFVPDHPSLIQLNATLRNQATFEQALPLLELTLLDEQERVLSKKVFFAKEYLAPLPDGKATSVPPSVLPGGDLRVFLRLDLGEMKSNGYQLSWFYAKPR